jgi:hypothetical protein
MPLRKFLLAAAILFANLAQGAEGDKVCVVCGEPTQGDHAVVWQGTAYPVHFYACKTRWNRAVAAEALGDLPLPIPAGHTVFSQEHAGPTRGQLARPQGIFLFWAAFWLFVSSLSGALGAFFGSMLQRSPAKAFLLGFLVPAVGMVLVPVLPARKTVTNRTATQEGTP